MDASLSEPVMPDPAAPGIARHDRDTALVARDVAADRAAVGDRLDRVPDTARATDITPAAEADAILEVAELLGHAVRRLHRGTNEALAPLGLSRTQARLVRLLADGPLRMAAIADRLAVVPRTITDLVDGVASAGLVERRADPEDRRATFVALTPDGRRLLDRLDAARRESASQVLAPLGDADLLELQRILRELAPLPAAVCRRALDDPASGTSRDGGTRR